MGFNARLFEVMLYPDSYDFNNLEVDLKSRSGLRHYAYIVHDRCPGKNGALKKTHAHVMLRMNNSHNSDNVAKWFGTTPNNVNKCRSTWAGMLAYLTHENAPDKVQYDPGLVFSNFEWQKEAKKAGQKKNVRLDEILGKISNGDIREYNIHDHVTPQEYAMYKAKFDHVFWYRIKKLKSKGVDRDMNCIYVWGDSGSGKTTEKNLSKGLIVVIITNLHSRNLL